MGGGGRGSGGMGLWKAFAGKRKISVDAAALGLEEYHFHARGSVCAGDITLDNTVLGSRKLFNVLWQWQALAVLRLVELW